MSRRPSHIRRRAGRTLVEVMVALAVFAVGSLGMWEVIRTTFFLAAKNTGLNMSHVSLQAAMDQMTNQIRSSMQVLDVATFDGTTFTGMAPAPGTFASGNAVRFLRQLPISLYVMPDKVTSTYDIDKPQDTSSPTYPDTLTPGNTAVKVRFNTSAGGYKQGFQAKEWSLDLKHARFFPRFPFMSETVSTGSSPSVAGVGKPGLALASLPDLSANPATLTLANGLPASTLVPSTNQAYFVVESAFAVLNRGTSYAELIYYPDASDVTRKNTLTSGVAVSTTGSGWNAFTAPNAGAPSDVTTHNTLQITLPVFQPNLNNVVTARGGTAALVNIELTATVEARRRASF